LRKNKNKYKSMKNKYKKLVIGLGLKPVGVYLNLLRDRAKILLENRSVAGVYCIIHKRSGKRYIGSSVNLAKRLNYYLSINQNSLLPSTRSAISLRSLHKKIWIRGIHYSNS